MSVTVLVTFDELPDAAKTFSYQEDQHEWLLKLEEIYRARVVQLLPPERQKAEAKEHDSRHFWFNGVFQPHRERRLLHIDTQGTIPLHFRPDAYLVSTPRRAGMEMKINPEQTIDELLTGLHARKMIGSACCFEIVDATGSVLALEQPLWEQVLPYIDPARKRDSHLQVRLRARLMRNAYKLLALCGIVGFVLGWLVHHYGKS